MPAREEHAAAEREISRNAARISALKEARQRISAGRDEAVAGREEAANALPRCRRRRARRPNWPQVNEDDRQGSRGACAEVRVEAQAIAREAELANRRLQAIAGERADWDERKNNAAAQIATIGQRTRGGNDRARPSSIRRRRNSPPSAKR